MCKGKLYFYEKQLFIKQYAILFSILYQHLLNHHAIIRRGIAFFLFENTDKIGQIIESTGKADFSN